MLVACLALAGIMCACTSQGTTSSAASQGAASSASSQSAASAASSQGGNSRTETLEANDLAQPSSQGASTSQGASSGSASAGQGASSGSASAGQGQVAGASSSSAASGSTGAPSGQTSREAIIQAKRDALDLAEDYRDSFVHGDKGAAFQKYIVMHDTEGEGDGASVVSYWDGNGSGVAAHFVVNKDGSIVQCVPLDKITHHAGFGDAGHNAQYGVEDESRDDKVGTVPIGDWAPDYGMNSYSIGIEMVHVGGSGGYPEEQLAAVDALIAYIDAYYGFESQIIDHKAWRSGNSDTSPEFSQYLANLQDHRTCG